MRIKRKVPMRLNKTWTMAVLLALTLDPMEERRLVTQVPILKPQMI